MADNDATIQSLTIDRIKLTPTGGDVQMDVLYTIDMLINEHHSVFQKDRTFLLPPNLQSDINNLWADIREAFLEYLDLDME